MCLKCEKCVLSSYQTGLKFERIVLTVTERKNGGKPWELTALRFVTKNQGSENSISNSKKRIEMHSHSSITLSLTIQILIIYGFFEFSEFTRAIVRDLSIGQSPIVLIDRFRVHCTNPQANWFGFLSFNCMDGSILVSKF